MVHTPSDLFVRNTVLQPLELVIYRAAHVLVRIFDDGHHEIGSLPFADPKREAVAQSANRAVALEAGEARPEHELHGRDELRRVRAQREEGGDAELLEECVALRVASAHQHDHFVVQLERAGLELDTARTYIEQETKVDVDDVALPIDHDVAIMTVLDLKNIACYGVCSH